MRESRFGIPDVLDERSIRVPREAIAKDWQQPDGRAASSRVPMAEPMVGRAQAIRVPCAQLGLVHLIGLDLRL
jgi:hypothetical protein